MAGVPVHYAVIVVIHTAAKAFLACFVTTVCAYIMCAHIVSAHAHITYECICMCVFLNSVWLGMH